MSFIMYFDDPRRLWFLLIAVPLALWARRGRRIKVRAWEALERWGRPRGDRSIAVLTAIVVTVAATARPRFGGVSEPSIGPGRDVVLAFDVSRSMGAEDAAPNRLGLAVEIARGLVGRLAGQSDDRAGVVAFAGRGVLRCPLTQNMGAVVDAIERLRPGDVRPGGTDLGAALAAAGEAFPANEPTEGRTVVLFSDGEDHSERWNGPLQRLIDAGVTVHAIAIGDADEGRAVPADATGRPLVHQGAPVVSKRVDQALEAIAERTGGACLKLGLATTDLGLLYQERIAPTARARRLANRAADRPERFPILLAAALACLVAGCRPFGRQGGARRPWKRSAGAATLAAAVLGGSGAARTESAADAVVWGRSAYADGRFAEALEAFETAAAKAPSNPVPHYNAAVCLFQMGRFAEAVDAYRHARRGAGAALAVKIDYGLGNARLRLGDLPGAIERYDACLASTARGADLDAVRRDAAENRRFALEKLQADLGRSDRNDASTTQKNRPSPPRSSDAREDDEVGEPPSENGRGERPGDDPEQARRGRTGGAGGGRRSPSGESDRSPSDRLDDAVGAIRDARRARLPDEPPADDDSPVDRKDW